MNFSARFEQLCRQRNENPTSIGTQLGFSKGTVSKWRNNKMKPNSKTLERISNYFGVSVDYLLGKSDIRNAESEFEDIERAKLILFGTGEVPEKAWWEVEQFVESTRRKYHIKSNK